MPLILTDAAVPPLAFVFIGNHRLLDFLNTEVAVEGRPRDLVAGLEDLVGWLERAGAIDRATARAAVRRWAGTRAGAALVDQARALRSALRRVADAAAVGRPAPRAALERVNALLARGAAVDRVIPSGRPGSSLAARFTFATRPTCWCRSRRPRADFICHADPTRVRRCAHPECVLYFLDGTKNGTRRWCDMRTCGNRANAAAYYRRHHVNG